MGHDRVDQTDRVTTPALEQGSGDMARQAWGNSSNHDWGQFSNSDSAASHLPGLTLEDSSAGAASSAINADSTTPSASIKASTDSTGADTGTIAGATSDVSTSQVLAAVQQDLQVLLKDETQLSTELQALIQQFGGSSSTSSGEAAAGTPNTSTGEAAINTPNTSTGEAATSTPNTSTGEAATSTPQNTSTGEAAASTAQNTSTGEAATSTAQNTSTGEAATATSGNTGSGEATTVGSASTTSGDATSGGSSTTSTTAGDSGVASSTPTTATGTDGGTTTAASGSDTNAGNAGLIGFFGGDTNAAEADSISSALGKDVVPSSYLDQSQPAAQTTEWNVGQYASWVAANPGEGMILSVPLTYDGQTLSSTASGANNSSFTDIAQQLVAAGQGNDTIRLGVEMNGSWATDNNDGNPTDFINAYNNAAEAMKAVPGANFKFDWNPSDGEQNNIPTEAYYPGNKNVDSIGVDVYDWNENNKNASPADTWNLLKTEAGGLNELAAFAQQQGKPFAIPEYAVSSPEGQAGNSNATSPGMGDDPSFINNVADFLNTQAQSEGVAFQTYFDSASGGVGTTLETSPNSYQAYVQDFGNGGVDSAEV